MLGFFAAPIVSQQLPGQWTGGCRGVECTAVGRCSEEGEGAEVISLLVAAAKLLARLQHNGGQCNGDDRQCHLWAHLGSEDCKENHPN